MNFNKSDYEASYGTSQQLPPSSAPEIAFAGRSNVGKSSLINKLLNRKNLARVSSVPGKTVTINFFNVDGVKFADLPGYGYAKVPFAEKKRWSELMENYFSSGRNIKLVVQLVDMRHKPTEDDISMMNYMSHYGYGFVVAATKCDKLNKTEFQKRSAEIHDELAEFGDIRIIPFSSLKGDGVAQLREEIEKYLR